MSGQSVIWWLCGDKSAGYYLLFDFSCYES